VQPYRVPRGINRARARVEEESPGARRPLATGINEGLISRLCCSNSAEEGRSYRRSAAAAARAMAIINCRRDGALTSLIFIISIGIRL